MYHKITNYARAISEKLEQHFDNDCLMIWITVLYAAGIALYFSFGFIVPWMHLCCGSSLLLLLILYYKHNLLVYVVSLLLLSTIIGYSNIKYKTEHLTTTSLLKKFIGSVEINGTLTNIEVFPNRKRLTIDKINSGNIAKTRLSLRNKLELPATIKIGDKIHLTALLLPIPQQIFPGSYNLRRNLYYQGIESTGFALSDILKTNTQNDKNSFYVIARNHINNFKNKLTTNIIDAIPGQHGAVIAALVTGEKSYINNATKQSFSDSGIAHILAISGLHMSIIVGIIFFVTRFLCCVIPYIAINFNSKKIASVVALCGAFVYLMISGSNLPAQRAFIMSAVVLGAILLDRIAITMRNVALAALIILILWPEVLISPSFQLSFSAVIALVAVYEKLYPKIQFFNAHVANNSFVFIARPVIYLGGIVISSIVATIATAPFTIFTFHKVSLIAIISNLVAIPLISFIIIPLILLNIILPIDLLQHYLCISIDGLIKIAEFFQGFTNYIFIVSYINLLSKWLIIAGMLMLTLLHRIGKVIGAILVIISILIHLYDPLPDIFINQRQNIIVINSHGKFYSNTKRTKQYAMQSLLRFMGQRKAYFLSPYTVEQQSGAVQINSYKFNNLNIVQRCERKNGKKYYLINVYHNNELILDNADFWYNGGHFIWVTKNGVRIANSFESNAIRAWS